MDKQEIAIINQKVAEYRDFRKIVFDRIEVLINKIRNAKFTNENKNKITSNLSEIRSSLGTVFVHYEEIGFAQTIKQDIEKLINTVDQSKLTKITKHAKRHFWLNDVCTCHGLLPSHSA